MFQKTYRYGAVVRRKPKKRLIGVRKENLRVKNRRNAAIHKYENKNGDWHPKSIKMLWIDEGSISVEHLKVRLQLKSS